MTVKILIAILMLCAMTFAQVPTAPVVDKKFLAVATVHAVACEFDAWTTVRNLHHGYVEQNIIIGQHPADATVWAFESGQAVGGAIITYYLKRWADRSHNSKAYWVILPLGYAAGHFYAGSHNMAIYDPVRYSRIP